MCSNKNNSIDTGTPGHEMELEINDAHVMALRRLLVSLREGCQYSLEDEAWNIDLFMSLENEEYKSLMFMLKVISRND